MNIRNAVLATVALATLVFANPPQQGPRRGGGGNNGVSHMIGIGAVLGSPFGDAWSNPGMRLNLGFASQFRFAFDFGYGSYNIENDGTAADDESSLLYFGVTPKYILSENDMELQLGPTIAFRNGETNNIETSDVLFGMVLGGEYFFNDYFSIGSELRAAYLTGSTEDADHSGVTTSALVAFNCYFN